MTHSIFGPDANSTQLHLGRRVHFLRKSPLVLTSDDILNHVVIAGRPPAANRLQDDLQRQLTFQDGGWIRFARTCPIDAPSACIPREAGRQNELSVLDLVGCNAGTYSPLHAGAPVDIAQRLVELFPPGQSQGAEYYRTAAVEALTTLLDAARLTEQACTLDSLATLLAGGDPFSDLCEAVSRAQPGHACLDMLAAVAPTLSVRSPLNASLAGLAGRLHNLTQSAPGKLMSCTEPTIDLDEVLRHERLLLVNLPEGPLGDTLQRMLIAHVRTSMIAQASAASGKATREPFGIFIDDPATVSDLLSGDVLDAAKALNIGFFLRSATLASIPNDLCSTKILFGMNALDGTASAESFDTRRLLSKQKRDEFHVSRAGAVVHGKLLPWNSFK